MKKLISVLILSLGLSQAAVAAVQTPTETKSVEKKQASTLTWIKKHPKTVAVVAATLVGAGFGVWYFQDSAYVKPALNGISSGYTKTKDAVCAFPGQAWTCTKDHPFYVGGGVTAVALVTAVAVDLARGKKSILRKLGKQEEKAAKVEATIAK